MRRIDPAISAPSHKTPPDIAPPRGRGGRGFAAANGGLARHVWGLLRLSAKSYVKQNRSFLLDTANGSSEPILPDAALCTNVRSLSPGQKRGKIKGSFAKGLWLKAFQRFPCQQRL